MTPLDYLFSLEFHGIKLGLDNITRLLDAAGNPHTAYPTVHVAGTNGKGSTVAILDAILRAAGYRVGRFTSPHLCDVRERFLINGEPIAPVDLDRLIMSYRRFGSMLEHPPTFFELNTAIAFSHFLECKVDIALIEVGLGGRFDSTNVITPLVSVITNIALEHTMYLGDTLEAIAFEKAGVIKPGVPLIIGEQQAGPRDVILDRANTLASPARLLGRDFGVERSGGTFDQRIAYRGSTFEIDDAPLALPGAHQAANAALAIAAAEELACLFPKVTADAVVVGLASASWPCRLERVLDDPPVYIDVAHNPAGMEAVAAALPSPCVVVLAVASDKDARQMIRSLAPHTNPLIVTQFRGARAMPVAVLAGAAGDVPCVTASSLPEAIEIGLREATTEKPLVILGSLFTAGEARTILVDSHGARPMRF